MMTILVGKMIMMTMMNEEIPVTNSYARKCLITKYRYIIVHVVSDQLASVMYEKHKNTGKQSLTYINLKEFLFSWKTENFLV